MWTLATTAACTFLMALLAPEFGFAQCATDPKCTEVQFRDPLNLETCLKGKLDLCSGKPETQEQQMDRLALCLTRTDAFPKLMFMFLDGIREAVFFGLKLIFPRATDALYELQQRMRGPSNRYTSQSWTMPKGCNNKINVSVPQTEGIKSCPGLVDAFCKGWKRHDRDLLSAALLSSFVCVLRNIPTGAALALLRKFVCNLLKTVTSLLRQTRTAPLLVPVLDLLRLLLNCEEYKPLAEPTLGQE